MCQIAAAEISHLEIDVTQIKSGQISATEIKTLKTGRVTESNRKLDTVNEGVNENIFIWPYLTAEL